MHVVPSVRHVAAYGLAKQMQVWLHKETSVWDFAAITDDAMTAQRPISHGGDYSSIIQRIMGRRVY
jgi:hypothetical protein